MLIARLQVTGVEPMATRPTNAQSPYQASSDGGIKAKSAKVSENPTSEAMAIRRTPQRSLAQP